MRIPTTISGGTILGSEISLDPYFLKLNPLPVLKGIISYLNNGGTAKLKLSSQKDLEGALLKHVNEDSLLKYVSAVRKSPWPEFEKFLEEEGTCSYTLIGYMKLFKLEKWPEVEHILSTSLIGVTFYSRYVLKERWKEHENLILSNPRGTTYMRKVYKERNFEFEETLVNFFVNNLVICASLVNFKFITPIW